MKRISPDSPHPLRLAVVGCGHALRSLYMAPLASLAGRVEIAALADPDAETVRGILAHPLFPGDARRVAVHSDASSLLAAERERLDAVMVLTPERFNAAVAALALGAGLPVYLEKPPAASPAALAVLVAAEAEAEKRSGGHVVAYAAFNRRHTPLFRAFRPPPGLRAVTGLLARSDRTVAAFPFTSVHLVDAAQHFSGLPLGRFDVAFREESGDGPEWVLSGTLGEDVACVLTFRSRARVEEEYLRFEEAGGSKAECWEMRFSEYRAPRNGKLVGPAEPLLCDDDDPLEAMGYTACLREFVSLRERNALGSTPHRLAPCGGTVAALRKMIDRSSEAASVPA